MPDLKRTGTFIEQNLFFLILFGLLLSGILVGALVFCNLSTASADTLSFLAKGYLETRAELGGLEILLKTLISSTIFLAVALFLSFSAVSQPALFILPFLKGLGLGASVAQIYSLTGPKGFIVVLLMIIPCEAVISVSMIIAVKESVRFSNLMLHHTLASSFTNGLRESTRLHCIRFLMLEVAVAVGALLDCFCSMLFSGILIR